MRILLAVVFCAVLVFLAAGLAMKRAVSGENAEARVETVASWMWEQATGEKEEDVRAAVRGALESYAESQQRFKARNGRYAEDVALLEGLPPGMRDAALPDPLRDFHGYLFTVVERNGAGPMDARRDFVLVAFPAFYPASGRRSFAIGPKGIVIEGDAQGAIVLNATELSRWRPAGG